MTYTTQQSQGIPGDNNMGIDVVVGAQFNIALDSNPTTGYSWSVKGGSLPAELTLIQTTYVTEPSDPQLVGQGGYQIWVLQANTMGRTSFTLEYSRSFESGEPARTESYTVNAGLAAE